MSSQYLAVKAAVAKGIEIGLSSGSGKAVIVSCRSTDNNFRESMEIIDISAYRK